MTRSSARFPYHANLRPCRVFSLGVSAVFSACSSLAQSRRAKLFGLSDRVVRTCITHMSPLGRRGWWTILVETLRSHFGFLQNAFCADCAPQCTICATFPVHICFTISSLYQVSLTQQIRRAVSCASAELDRERKVRRNPRKHHCRAMFRDSRVTRHVCLCYAWAAFVVFCDHGTLIFPSWIGADSQSAMRSGGLEYHFSGDHHQ